jgi:AcrR family transcriptional regulator
MSRQAETARPDAPPHAPGTGRMAAEERRQQIVRVAMQLFSERGFRGTTTKEIAQAAGVSEAIIFRHFATKDDLYTAIIDHKSCEMAGPPCGDESQHPVVNKIQRCVGEVMECGDDRAVFEGIALTMMEHHEQDPQFLRLLLYSALEGHQLAQIFWERNVREMYEFLGSYIRRRQREGAFRAGLDPRVVVRALAGTIIHHSLNNTLWDTEPARRILNISNEEAARAFTEILLRGITAEESKRGPARKSATPAAGHRSAKKKQTS